MPGSVLTFGRYAGRDVTSVAEGDRNYALWLLTQSSFRRDHLSLYLIVLKLMAKRLDEELTAEYAVGHDLV